MSQSDFGTLDPNVVSGTQLAIYLNEWRDALHTLHRGAARPAYAQGGMMWVRETAADRWDAMMYDGNTDVLIFSINPTTGAPINTEVSATEPAVTYAYQRWWDTSGTPPLLKLRNAADDGWHTLGAIVSGKWVPYSAGESADDRYARLAADNDFDETPTVGGSLLLTESALATAIATRNIATVRQTTERGPVDANGLPDLLEDAGGLQVQTKGISASTPLVVVLTLNDDEDYRVRITSNLAAVTLADDTDDQQIVLDVTPEETPELVVTPVWTFAEVAPSSPSTGDVWYNTRHWGLPQEWDGSAWVDKYFSFPLGQASAASGAVTGVTSYAYKGRYEENLGSSFTGTGQVLAQPNIGAGNNFEFKFLHTRAADILTVFSSAEAATASGSARRVSVSYREGGAELTAESSNYTIISTSGGAATINWNAGDMICRAWRSF